LDIEDYDDFLESQNNHDRAEEADDDPNDPSSDQESDDMFHVKLGAAQTVQTFETLERLQANDDAFKRFRIKLAGFLSDFLPAHGIPLPGGQRIKFTPDDTVCRCFIYVESLFLS
jgi:hypothetical protein